MLLLIGLGAALVPAIGSAQPLSIQGWQKAMKDAPQSKPGCFQASYPSMQWTEVSCAQPSGIAAPLPRADLAPPNPIGGTGYSASVAGNAPPIMSAEGSFINVKGVTEILDSEHPGGPNTYSLQINSNDFNLPAGSFCSDCSGWTQFVYTQNLYYVGSEQFSSNGIHTEYYIIWGNVPSGSCPSPWHELGVHCRYVGTSFAIPQPSASLSDIVLSGKATGMLDTVTAIIGGQAYSTSGERPAEIKNFPQVWRWAQFNIFGIGGGSQVNFNDGAELTVRTKIDNGTTNPPICSVGPSTGETNALYHNSPCCAYGGAEPSIAFVEGTDHNPDKFQCPDLGNNTITPVVTPTGGGTITPSVALQVPNRAVSTFTVTPSANYKISSVTGCGGSLNGNVFTTAPATGNCTVYAQFTQGPSTYPIGGTVSGLNGSVTLNLTGTNPANTQTLIRTANGTFTFPAALQSGSNWTVSVAAQPANQTCTVTSGTGSNLSASVTNVYVSCTTNLSYTVTGNANPGGTISMLSAQVKSGETYTFTVTPNPGYYIYSISGCDGTAFFGDSANTTARSYTTGAVTRNCTVSVLFGKIPSFYTITSLAYNSGGSISPVTAQVQPGSTYTFTVTPDWGYYIYRINGCGGTQFNGNQADTGAHTYTTGPINSNCRVYMFFGETQYLTHMVSTYASPGGSISPTSKDVSAGKAHTVTVTPNTGYYISSISGCDGKPFNGNSANTTAYAYTTAPIVSKCTVSAQFAPVPR